MRKAIYLPAYTFTGLATLKKNLKKYNSDKSFRFYNENDNPVFLNDGLLISAGAFYKDMTMKDSLGIDLNKSILLGDSGGYQIATGVIDPKSDYLENIFNWLENNTNYAINIDIPLHAFKQGVDITIEEKLNISNKNFTYFEKNQTGKTKYLNVQHGKNIKELDMWFDQVSSKHNFDGGWCIGSIMFGEQFYALQSLFYLILKGRIIKNNPNMQVIHFLGSSSTNNMITWEYLQKKLNEYNYNYQLTYDSSTTEIAAGHGQYILFTDIEKIKYLNLSFSYKNINKESYLPCNCPVCEGVQFKYFYDRIEKESFSTLTYAHLGFHNLYQMLDYKNKIIRILNTDDKNLYLDIFGKKIVYIFNVIDLMFENINNYNWFLGEKTKIISEKKMNYDINLNKKRLF